MSFCVYCRISPPPYEYLYIFKGGYRGAEVPKYVCNLPAPVPRNCSKIDKMRKKAVFLRCEPLKRSGRPITHTRKNNAVKRKKIGMGGAAVLCVRMVIFVQ